MPKSKRTLRRHISNAVRDSVNLVTASTFDNELSLQTNPVLSNPVLSNPQRGYLNAALSSESETCSEQESSETGDPSSQDQLGSISDDSCISFDSREQQFSADINHITEELVPSTSVSVSATQKNSVESFKTMLQTWAIRHNVTHECLTDLLKVQRTHPCFAELPGCSRTLLQTPRMCMGIVNIGGGQYCHFGLATQLQQSLENVQHFPGVLNLHINIDGLPLRKSTKEQFWPILCQVVNCGPGIPFPVGVFYGHSKALKANEFLQPLVDDLNAALDSGVTIRDVTVQVKLTALVCDAPARAYILHIKGHSGYSSCSRCTTEGVSLGRMCFPELDAPLRTNDSFRSHVDEGHHTGVSILEKLPIDMVAQVPLDYMHLVCIGVVHKLMRVWLKGPKACRMGSNVKDELSTKSEALRHFVPSDFSRRPRSFWDMEMWKATEFRLLLLYTGPVIFPSTVRSDLQANFMILHCAITILASPRLSKELVDYAEKLLRYFVETCKSLFGTEFISYNVHGLLHLENDVRAHGHLDRWSAFAFENYMQNFKKSLRKPEKPLEQLCNRLAEKKNAVAFKDKIRPSESIKFSGKHEDFPLPSHCRSPQYRKVDIPGRFCIATNKRDNTCTLLDGGIIEVHSIAFSCLSKKPVLVGRRYSVVEDLYTYPCRSSLLNISLVSCPHTVSSWPLQDVAFKCVRLPLGDKFAVYPLLHLN
ncbi:uncharacterized protein ISCGN_025208 [Ixodes scapularis]